MLPISLRENMQTGLEDPRQLPVMNGNLQFGVLWQFICPEARERIIGGPGQPLAAKLAGAQRRP
jgi:hypothetical protein